MSKHKKRHHKHDHIQQQNQVIDTPNEKMSDEDSITLINRILDVTTRAMFKLTLCDSIYFMEARKQLIACLKKRKEYNDEKYRLANYRQEWQNMKSRENKKEREMIKRTHTRKISGENINNHDVRSSVMKQIECAEDD